MARLDWRNQGLTDSQLLARLSELSTEEEYTTVLLYHNKLDTVPDWTKYRQFGRLEVLRLNGNHISRVEAERLPHTIRVLYMRENNIRELGDLSELHQLERLWLHNNQLTEVDTSHIPQNVREVGMAYNNICHVGDFSQHKQLERLYLHNNTITSIDRRNTKLSGWLITILGEKFFETEEGYNFVCVHGLSTDDLEQPPREVFKRGYEAVKSYYTDMRLSKTVRNSRKRVVLLGLTEAGKTSMAESLISGKAILINIQDRTQVVDIKLWHITEDDLIHLYDHGGHDVYNIASPLFISKECLIFVVHDICKVKPDEVEKTIGVLRQALHQYPENEMHLILTHTDCLNPGEAHQNRDAIKDAIQQHLGQEIDNLNRILSSKHSGTANQDLIDDTKQLRGHFVRQRQALSTCYSVSSANYSGMDQLKALLVAMAEKKRTTVPDSWVQFYKGIIENKKHYLTLDDIYQMYEACKKDSVHTDYGFEPLSPVTLSDSAALVPLQYFADTNLVLHYHNNPFLKDFVFHNIDFLINVMKSVFNHDIGQIVNYENDRHLQSLFQKVECELAVKQYQTEGLLGRKMLQFLWKQYGLKIEDEDILLHLLHSFNICYNISPDKENDLQFFPWFVQSQECPQHVDTNNPMIFDKEHTSVHFQCKFFNRIPLNVFEMLCVCLQKKATKESHYMGDRMAWRDGLMVSYGSIECILTRSSQKSTIDICLRGKVEDLLKLWKLMDSLLEDLMKVLKKYHGIIKSYHIICNHCVVMGISPPNLWLPKHVFPQPATEVPRFVKCPKGVSNDIPAALIVNIFKAESTKEQETGAINDVAKYLQENWKPNNPPEKLLFVDCEQISPEEFSVSWALPNVVYCGNPITNIVIEVRRMTDDSWECISDSVVGNTYTYRGAALEFRVAAQNKYGIGKFTRCVPACDVSDDLLSSSDRVEMEHNKETFAQMTCVEKIVVRLSSRHVIPQVAEERVIRCLNEHKSFQAARMLLEEILRCNYQQLFRFRKTLEEFGQEHLAALVPVRKRHGPVFSEEMYNRYQSTGNIPVVVYERQHTQAEHRSHTTATQCETLHSIQDGTDRSIRETTHRADNLPCQQDPQGQAQNLLNSVAPQLQYTLLDELTSEQKNQCPGVNILGNIIASPPDIHSLGFSLGFSVVDIEELEKYRPESPSAQTMKMLETWKQKAGRKATVGRLVKGLQRCKIPESSYKQHVLDDLEEDSSD